MPQFFPVSPEAFRQFVRQVDYWKGRLALDEWTCTQLRHSKTGPDDVPIGTSNAMVSVLLSNRVYVLTCNEQWAIEVNDANIDYVAFHEVCHLLLAELWDIAYDHCPPAVEEAVNNAEHAAIARLNKAFAPLAPRFVMLQPMSREDSVASAPVKNVIRDPGFAVWRDEGGAQRSVEPGNQREAVGITAAGRVYGTEHGFEFR